ncbi:MAG: CDP-alcohol phosphatidyltransferase family protein [Polyangiaceae bacterium]|nr:CDP-alcohol phosphatidyltransferase family protein [Polyangiaceae bacterium]
MNWSQVFPTLHRGGSGTGEPHDGPSPPRVRLVPPAVATKVTQWLERAADWLVAHHVSADSVTWACLAASALAGLAFAGSAFGIATVLLVAAVLGDALDGMVARRSHTESERGALLDASSDRYQEFFVLAGVAVALRGSTFTLAAALFAIAGSFMVSYGSARAEARHAPVPPGLMQRAERAVVLCAGAALTAVCLPIAHGLGLARGFGLLPLTLAVLSIAVFANASAISRLHAIADGLRGGGGQSGASAASGSGAGR